MSVVRRLLQAAGGSGSFSSGGGSTPPPTSLFVMFNGQNGDAEYHIGQATSTDSGVTWTEDGANPVISKSGSDWVSVHVKDPWPMPDGLSAYVSGYNGSGRYQIGRVTRPNTSSTSWTYDSTVTPTIALGGGGAADEHGCAFPTVLDEGSGAKRYKMWYRGADSADKETVCYAYSSDGLSWTKIGRVIDVGSGGTWNDVGVGPGGIYKDGSTYYLFVAGRQSAAPPTKWQGGVWSFTDPEGTYTPAAGNPTLLAAFNTSGVSQVLTADTLVGSAIVTVTTTSHWSAGWPMVIADANSETEVHRISSIDSSTQVTLDSVVAENFTVGAGATFRPVEMVSVWPRTVMMLSSLTMFFTPFQPVDDLTVGGTQLREFSMKATASAPDGSWTIDHATGLFFPYYPATSGWHKFSAENPAIIAL